MPGKLSLAVCQRPPALGTQHYKPVCSVCLQPHQRQAGVQVWTFTGEGKLADRLTLQLPHSEAGSPFLSAVLEVCLMPAKRLVELAAVLCVLVVSVLMLFDVHLEMAPRDNLSSAWSRPVHTELLHAGHCAMLGLTAALHRRWPGCQERARGWLSTLNRSCTTAVLQLIKARQP